MRICEKSSRGYLDDEVVVMTSVKAIIDEWDPIDLFSSFAPSDEYWSEIFEIECLVGSAKDAHELAEGIFHVFQRWFGAEIFTKSKEECFLIARKILDAGNSDEP